MNISVLYNAPTERFTKHAAHWEAEEDTGESAREVAVALTEKGATVKLVQITEHTIESTVQSLDADLVFNLIEWTGVDLPYAQQTYDAMDKRHIHYTGASKANYVMTCDKGLTKEMLDQEKLPTAPWQLFITGKENIRKDFHYPVIVKVSREHSSVGLTKDAVVHDASELKTRIMSRLNEYKQPVYAEEFLSGREFQITLFEQGKKLIVLPPAEIVFTKVTDVPFLTYESRWDMTHSDYNNSIVKLARLDRKLARTLEDMSRRAFTTLGFYDYARFDIRCDTDGNPYFLEINSNPGLGDDDEYGMTVSYKAVGMTFADLIWKIVESALRRNS